MQPVDMNNLSGPAKACLEKMRAAKINETCIRTFLSQHALISSGTAALIPESDIRPVESLPSLEDLHASSNTLLDQTVVLKLNGGLGTGMGLHDAKTLLEVKDGKTFLDFIALHVQHLRETSSPRLRFMLMNSFNTAESTKKFLQKYPELFDRYEDVQLMQNEVPKILQDTLEPVEWPANPRCEWSPPGHGDIYAALYGSGKLKQLLSRGYRYMFVSNGDNLGATVEPRILAHMETENIGFLMEVCHRTPSDSKGGHLAVKVPSSKEAAGEKEVLLLREAAQCPEEDKKSFEDIQKYAYFNTNNLWINLSALEETMSENDGMLPLPLIRNAKTVDPTDPNSPKVYQLETAMGAAISSFERSAAVVVPRDRFAPVKSTGDLLSLRSDAYDITADYRLVLSPMRNGAPPTVSLDGRYYKFMKGLESLVQCGVPSMLQCERLTIKGPVTFGKNNTVEGDVVIENKGEEVVALPDNKVLDGHCVL